MKSIIHLLQLTPEFYAEKHFDFYVSWCGHYGGTPHRMQTLLCNQRVYEWFCNEYRKQELLFLETVNPKLGVKQIRVLYAEMTNKVLERYPAPFVKGLQKLKLQSNHN